MSPSERRSPDEPVSADKLFKSAFEIFLKDLVELTRPELAARLDFDHPKFLPRERFTDLRLSGHLEPDLAAEVPARHGGEGRVLIVHVDTEGRFRREVDERMAKYGLLLYLTTRKIVVSITVFLKGGEPGVHLRTVGLEGEGWNMADYHYLAFGLSGSRAEDWIDRPQPLAAALAALMRTKKWDKVEHKLRCLERISQARLDVRQGYVLGKIVDKYLSLSKNEQERFTAELARETHQEVRKMAVTWEEALEEREARGRAEGLSEGQIEAARKAILLMAGKFWSEVPARLAEQLETIQEPERLYEILERVPEVRSVEDLRLD